MCALPAPPSPERSVELLDKRLTASPAVPVPCPGTANYDSHHYSDPEHCPGCRGVVSGPLLTEEDAETLREVQTVIVNFDFAHLAFKLSELRDRLTGCRAAVPGTEEP